MSSEEDFSIVSEVQQPSEVGLRDVMTSINKYKKKYEQLLQEQKEAAASRDDHRKMADEYRRRTETLKQKVEQEQSCNKEKIQNDKDRLKLLLQEEAELLTEVQTLEGALKEEEAQIEHLKQQTKVFAAAPDRRVYFAGSTAKADNRPTFDMGSRIVYMMEGGTALITFEEDVVARKILELKEHQVDLGSECRITVEAQPVQVMIPKLVEVDTQVCSRRILISNLPKMDVETLLNKLEIHFSKKRNGGGEVDSCEMMADTWTVVIAFVDTDVTEGLTLTEFHNVQLQQKTHRVRVTPFLNGNIANLETEMVVCPQTVLLTGIPNVMEQETLQDLLEIHFQKSTNGGGEIDACVYNPVGHQTSAVFEGGAE